jgi:uncharacterized protein YjbI with pentapeptide repeats
MIGIDFSTCNDLMLSFTFHRCLLDFTSFLRKKIKKTQFKECSIKEANFTEADLSGAVFDHCDLSRTIFYQTNLQKSDFRRAMGFSIDPENNQIRKAKFSRENLPGLLDKYQIEIE